MLATGPSLRELNNRLDDPVSMLQMRPNIVVEGTFTPWSEVGLIQGNLTNELLSGQLEGGTCRR